MLLRSKPVGTERKGSKIVQREKLGCDRVSGGSSADPTVNTEAKMAL